MRRVRFSYPAPYYEKINYCDETKNILNTVEMYKDCQYWNPTLVKANKEMPTLPTDNLVEPSRLELFMMNRLEGNAKK